uniref:Uncharacterized protein n=1 Tax=Chaetoceros debilis TaxID=122233 RepID=A0A7S3Q0J5_9STRA
MVFSLRRRRDDQHPTGTVNATFRFRCYFLLLVASVVIILIRTYNDVQIAMEMFTRPSLTQTTLDTEVAFIAPIYGGSDLIPPHGTDPNVHIQLMPTFGKHRPDEDVIFAIANHLTFEEYVLFVMTLRDSGFEGDLVLSTQDVKSMDGDLIRFLKYHSNGGGIIVYDGVIRDNANDSSINPSSNTTAAMVYLKGLYGKKREGNDQFTILDDKRVARNMGVAQFELFWVWSTRYSPSSRMLIIDAHDTFFQENGGFGIGVSKACPLLPTNNSTFTTSRTEPSIIHLYEENQKNAQHKLNKLKDRLMLPVAYKDRLVLQFMHNENILSPSPTHGHQRAMEAYFRAMVRQFDHTQCTVYHCEWAFHNYIYYFGILHSLPEIRKVKNIMQGTGAVNSVGLDVPLNQSEMFNAGTQIVYNRPMGMGLQPSWAVHQYDRDQELNQTITKLKKRLVETLNYDEPAVLQGEPDIDQNLLDAIALMQPALGKHREGENVVIANVPRRFDSKKLAFFLLTAREYGFEGDIVIHIPKLDDSVKFLMEQEDYNIIVYEGEIVPDGHGWKLAKSEIKIIEEQQEGPRPPRSESIVAFELFYILTMKYRRSSRILLVENVETALFQSNPFKEGSCSSFELSLFKEHTTNHNFLTIRTGKSALSEVFHLVMGEAGMTELVELGEKVLTPRAILGHAGLMQQFIAEMLRQVEEFHCYSDGCNWALVNNIWYKTISAAGSEATGGISYKFRTYLQGIGDIHPIPMSEKLTNKFFDAERGIYHNYDQKVIPSVVLDYNLQPSMKTYFEEKAKELIDIAGW